MKIAPGIYANCIECSTLTPMEDEMSDPLCGSCDMDGEDPYITQVERVVPCLHPSTCNSEDHHFGTGMHHVEIEQ